VRHCRNLAATTILRLAFTLAAIGCGGSASEPPGPVRFRAQSAGVAFESFMPARIDVALGSAASAFELSASAASDRGVWSARATLTRDQALAGAASVEIGATALAPGQVQINGSRLLQAESGKLDVVFGQGVASGTVTGASPELLNGGFTGELLVSCWVPPSALPVASRPTADVGAPADSEALVLDAKFETTACMPFQILE
jgi:hypothetical protein